MRRILIRFLKVLLPLVIVTSLTVYGPSSLEFGSDSLKSSLRSIWTKKAPLAYRKLEKRSVNVGQVILNNTRGKDPVNTTVWNREGRIQYNTILTNTELPGTLNWTVGSRGLPKSGRESSSEIPRDEPRAVKKEWTTVIATDDEREKKRRKNKKGKGATKKDRLKKRKSKENRNESPDKGRNVPGVESGAGSSQDEEEEAGDRPEAGRDKKGRNLPRDLVSPRPILLVSSYRSGSTFLGELLTLTRDDSFYSYEPLHYYNTRVDSARRNFTKILQYLKDVLHCRWDDYPLQVRYLSRKYFWRNRDKKLKKACRTRNLCEDPKFTGRMCRKAGLHVIKVVRLSLKSVQLLLEDPANSGLKVVNLVRDPRGSFSSRWTMPWCVNVDCNDPNTVCRNQMEDLSIAKMLRQRYPKRFILIKYEDLSLNPTKVIQNLWSFLDLKFTRKTSAILDTNTKTISDHPYSTQRNSVCHAFAWRRELNYTGLLRVQKSCKGVIASLGMRVFRSEEEYRNHSLPVMLGMEGKEAEDPACT